MKIGTQKIHTATPPTLIKTGEKLNQTHQNLNQTWKNRDFTRKKCEFATKMRKNRDSSPKIPDFTFCILPAAPLHFLLTVLLTRNQLV